MLPLLGESCANMGVLSHLLWHEQMFESTSKMSIPALSFFLTALRQVSNSFVLRLTSGSSPGFSTSGSNMANNMTGQVVSKMFAVERMLITLMFNVHRKTPATYQLSFFHEFALCTSSFDSSSSFSVHFCVPLVPRCFSLFVCLSIQLHSRASFQHWHFDQVWSLFGIKWQPIYWRYEHLLARQWITCQQKPSASAGGLEFQPFGILLDHVLR